MRNLAKCSNEQVIDREWLGAQQPTGGGTELAQQSGQAALWPSGLNNKGPGLWLSGEETSGTRDQQQLSCEQLRVLVSSVTPGSDTIREVQRELKSKRFS